MGITQIKEWYNRFKDGRSSVKSKARSGEYNNVREVDPTSSHLQLDDNNMTSVTPSKTVAFMALTITTVIFAALVTYASGVPVTTQNRPDALKYVQSLRSEKIILDVDAGVDDAMAIMLALLGKELSGPQVIAITCTHGNIDLIHVAINVLKTLRVVKSEIPVYMGAYSSLTVTPPGDSFFGEDGFGDVPDPNPPTLDEIQKEHAVNAMVRLVRQYPGQITLVSVGPLSNVALAIRMDPTFHRNLKALYWMGGSVQGMGNVKPGVEFNAYVDPEANYIVFNSTGVPVIIFPWESCLLDNIGKAWRMNVLGRVDSPFVQFLNRIEAKSLQKSSNWPACDAKAMSIVLDGSIATRVSKHYTIPVYEGEAARGALMVDYNDRIKPTNAIIIHDMDNAKFRAMCLKNLS